MKHTTNSRVYIYSPFLMAIGGGERYFAESVVAISRRYLVTILVHHQQASQLSEIAAIFSVRLSTVDVAILQDGEPYSIESASEIAARVPADSAFLQFTNGEFVDIDCCLKLAHIQIVVPRSGDTKLGTEDILRFGVWLRGLDAAIYPSNYVLREMQRRYMTNNDTTHCLYPPVHLQFLPIREHAPALDGLEEVLSIVSVGRFVPIKKQSLIIEAYQKTLYSTACRVKLVIIGPSETPYLSDLRNLARGMDVEFLVGLNVEEIRRLYSQSTILWSATGFGEDEFGLVETFGLSIAEAMSCGCVPVVAGGGGVREIVSDGVDGYVVEALSGLIDRSAVLLNDPERRQLFSDRAIHSAARFRADTFSKQLIEILDNISDGQGRSCL